MCLTSLAIFSFTTQSCILAHNLCLLIQHSYTKCKISSEFVSVTAVVLSMTDRSWAFMSFHVEGRGGFIHSQLDFSSSNFSGSIKGLSMDLIISSPQYTHSDAMISSMSDFNCSRLVPALPFSKLEASPSSLGTGRWRVFEDCVVAASFFWSSSRRVCL